MSMLHASNVSGVTTPGGYDHGVAGAPAKAARNPISGPACRVCRARGGTGRIVDAMRAKNA
jgi:hypothetical protein